MADTTKIDRILAELSKEPEFRALGMMISTAENQPEREAIEKRARAELSRILRSVYYPKEVK